MGFAGVRVAALGAGMAMAALVPLAADAPSPPGRLDVSDGVSEREAHEIAGALFRRYVGCGATGEARFVDDHWEINAHLDYAGTPGPPVLVHGESGVVSWGPGCSVLRPHDLFYPSVEIETCGRWAY